jgi:hypothetical protein
MHTDYYHVRQTCKRGQRSNKPEEVEGALRTVGRRRCRDRHVERGRSLDPEPGGKVREREWREKSRKMAHLSHVGGLYCI